MSSNNYRNRYYSKKKYEAAIETLGVGFVFLFVAILSLFFLAFGVPFIGLGSWGYWLFIPAFFIILGGVQQYYTNEKFQKSVRVAILDRSNQGTHKLEDIALEVGIKPKDVLKVLIDLRQKGAISYRFNSETGEIILGEKVAYVKSKEFVVPPKQLAEPLETAGKGYCVYCGHELSTEGNFCENCGSKI
ncbi:MAG: zinc ribbon domain-containing protein [Promethearchaeota archaeon]